MRNGDCKTHISPNVAAIAKKYRERLLSSFLQDPDVPALLSKGQFRSISSMRSDGFTQSGTLHELCANGHVGILRLVLASLLKASAGQDNEAGHTMTTIVDMLKVEHVMNERGYHADSHETPLHLALQQCPYRFQPLDVNPEELAKQHRMAREAERAKAQARAAERRAKWREGRPERRATRREQRDHENRQAAVRREINAHLKAFRQEVAAESAEQRQSRLAAWKQDGVYQFRKEQADDDDEDDDCLFDPPSDDDGRYEEYDDDVDYQERDWLVAPAGLDAKKRLGGLTATQALETILSLRDDPSGNGFLPLNSVREDQDLDSKSLESESESSDEAESLVDVDVKKLQEQNTTFVKRFQNFLQVCSLLLDAGADPNKIRATLMQVPNPDSENSTTDDPRDDGYESPVLCVRLLQSPLSLALPGIKKCEEPLRLPHDFRAFALVYLLVLKGADTSLGSFQGNSMMRSPWFDSGRRSYRCSEDEEDMDRLAQDCCQGWGESFTKGKRQPLPGTDQAHISQHKDVEQHYLSALHGEWSAEFFRLHPAELQQNILVLFMALKRYGIGSTLAAKILGDCLAMSPVAGLFA